MLKWVYSLGAMLVIVYVAVTLTVTHSKIQEIQEIQEELYSASIQYVIDGDTVIVNKDGEEMKVRLIGVNTPESVSRTEENTEEGYIASEFTKGYLQEGQTVWLEYDIQRTDRYGRTLAYLWLTDQADRSSYEDFCTYNYGAILLQNTYCEAKAYLPNIKYRSWYERLETE